MAGFCSDSHIIYHYVAIYLAYKLLKENDAFAIHLLLTSVKNWSNIMTLYITYICVGIKNITISYIVTCTK